MLFLIRCLSYENVSGSWAGGAFLLSFSVLFHFQFLILDLSLSIFHGYESAVVIGSSRLISSVLSLSLILCLCPFSFSAFIVSSVDLFDHFRVLEYLALTCLCF